MNRAKYLVLPAVTALVLSACSNSDVDESAAESDVALAKEAPAVSFKPESSYDSTIATPGAPFSVSYNVVGTPIVGSPVTVNLRVTSAMGSQPIKVSYRINDDSAMTFHEAQPFEVEIAPADNEDTIMQQVTVIPQREGRLYLNVGASVDTESGSMSSVMAIPIQVGAGTRDLEEHGEVQLDEDGEAIRVLTSE